MSSRSFPERDVTIDNGRDPVGPEHVTKIVGQGYAIIFLTNKHIIGPHVLELLVIGIHLVDVVFVVVVAGDETGVSFFVTFIQVFAEHIVQLLPVFVKGIAGYGPVGEKHLFELLEGEIGGVRAVSYTHLHSSGQQAVGYLCEERVQA